MAKTKTVFFCNECGNESPKWMGQCTACGQWNTYVEEVVHKKASKSSGGARNNTARQKPQRLSDISIDDESRDLTNISELDRVLGGGIVKGSLILVGGDPGIGKSTLLLQMCRTITDKKILYISGEESLRQIKLRASRLGVKGENLLLLNETSIDLIEGIVDNEMPDILIIDSIQTMLSEDVTSAAGSVSQVREVTNRLMMQAKLKSVSTFIVGHVTKEGAIAGPRVLEHMVDTVLYFEGQRSASYRILRAVKNRFGSTNEIGVFEMADVGLKEVANPSEYMLEGRPLGESGSCITCSIEGTRPMLIEVQALMSQSNFPAPRRTTNGTDYNRVNMLLAVVEKKLGVMLGDYDSYINIAGGIKILEPAIDLSIIASIISSFRNIAISEDIVIMGEVGLTGEIRGISMCEKRIIEARKLGFKQCIIPKNNYKSEYSQNGFSVYGISHISELKNILFN